MDKSEVERNMLQAYPEYIKLISGLIDMCLKKVDYIHEHNKNWIVNNDTRFAVFGKYVTALNATRISLFQGIEFLSRADWVDVYNKNFSIKGKKNDFFYLNGLDIQARFASYIGFVSQFESSISIIIRYLLLVKEMKCAEKYGKFIDEQLKLHEWQEFIKIVRHTRNSIHNNGIYIPEKITHGDEYITYKGIVYEFKRNKRVKLSWEDCFIIYKELIELTCIVNDHALIVQEELIEDIVVNS